MTISNFAQVVTSIRNHGAPDRIRRFFGIRRILWIGAALAFAAGLMFRWNWLVAAGVAPILVSLLPCAAMCALGFCAHKAVTAEPPKQPVTNGNQDPARPTGGPEEKA